MEPARLNLGNDQEIRVMDGHAGIRILQVKSGDSITGVGLTYYQRMNLISLLSS